MTSRDCPNPLLLEWAKEWWDTARERHSKGVLIYKNAYESLKACPMELPHPSMLQQLRGWGPKLCERMTGRLRDYCKEKGLPMPEVAGRNITRKNKRKSETEISGEDEACDRPRPAKRSTTKQYVPAYRSGGYALVVALSSLDRDETVGLPKATLVQEAQPHCDTSFTATEAGKFHTAWNSMKTLLDKELVVERGRPLKRYMLTDDGWAVAQQLHKNAPTTGRPNLYPLPPTRAALAVEQGGPGSGPGSGPGTASAPLLLLDVDEMDASVPTQEPAPRAVQEEYAHVVADGNGQLNNTALPSFQPITLRPGSFTVEMVLDMREIRSRTHRDLMQEELTNQGVKPIKRALALGDILWVAKCKDAGYLSRCGAEGDEVVLDWIVERKRLDDLINSIKDGRLQEQKFRLARSGLKRVVYLVEDMAIDPGFYAKYEEACQSIMARIQVLDGFFLKKTQGNDETIRYLVSLTNMLKKVYESKEVHVIPTKYITLQNYKPLLNHLRETKPSMDHYITYPAFASLASKSDTLSLRDVYLKMLMCTKGVTGEKAVAIQKKWKTPYDLVKAFEKYASGEEGMKVKTNLLATYFGNMIPPRKLNRDVTERLVSVWGNS